MRAEGQGPGEALLRASSWYWRLVEIIRSARVFSVLSGSPLRSSPSPRPTAPLGTIDSDGWDASFADISSTVPLPVSDRCFGHLQPTLLQRAKPSNFLLDRKKTDKLKKKKKRKRRDSDGLGRRAMWGDGCSWKPPPICRNPHEPTLQDAIPQAAGDPCSGWDSELLLPVGLAPRCHLGSGQRNKNLSGKRTIVRQGKQVVFRDGYIRKRRRHHGGFREWPRGGMLRVGFQDPNLPSSAGLWVQSPVEELRSHVPAMRCGVSRGGSFLGRGQGSIPHHLQGKGWRRQMPQMFRKVITAEDSEHSRAGLKM